jgi:hypothetical protein
LLPGLTLVNGGSSCFRFSSGWCRTSPSSLVPACTIYRPAGCVLGLDNVLRNKRIRKRHGFGGHFCLYELSIDPRSGTYSWTEIGASAL